MICTTGKPYCIFQESVVSLLWYIDGREGLILITRTSEHVTFYGKREFTGMITLTCFSVDKGIQYMQYTHLIPF